MFYNYEIRDGAGNLVLVLNRVPVIEAFSCFLDQLDKDSGSSLWRYYPETCRFEVYDCQYDDWHS